MNWSSLDMFEGIRNFVADMNVQPGEKALVLTDTRVDPAIPQTVAILAKHAGANVTTMIVDPFREWSIPNALVMEAAKKADILFGATSSLITRNPDMATLQHDFGIKLGMLVTVHPEILAGDACRFPRPLMALISGKMHDIAGKGTRIRVVDDKGTDVTAEYRSIRGIRTDIPLERGGTIAFPLGAVGPEPILEANGVAYFNSVNSFPGYYPSTWKEPIKVKIESGMLKSIEGGPVAKRLEQMIRKVKRADELVEVMWGFNPKMPVWGYMNETNKVQIERHSGIIHFGFANGYDTGGLHIDCEILEPTVYIDNEIIIEKGRLRLLEDPQVKSEAAKFGDPEEVLAEIW